jgi:hypothetical protein
MSSGFPGLQRIAFAAMLPCFKWALAGWLPSANAKFPLLPCAGEADEFDEPSTVCFDAPLTVTSS